MSDADYDQKVRGHIFDAADSRIRRAGDLLKDAAAYRQQAEDAENEAHNLMEEAAAWARLVDPDEGPGPSASPSRMPNR